MTDPIRTYTEAVERDLAARIGHAEAHLQGREIEAHLRERTAAHIELGMTPEQAMTEAIYEFGRPKSIAQQYPPRVFPAGPVMVIASILYSAILVLVTSDTSLVGMLSWTPGVYFATMGIAPMFSRKWPWGAGLASATLLYAAGVLTLSQAMPFERVIPYVFEVFLPMIGLITAGWLVGFLVRSVAARYRRRPVA